MPDEAASPLTSGHPPVAPASRSPLQNRVAIVTGGTSAFAATKAVAPHMVRARYGRVVLVASRAVVPPAGGFVAYTVSKAGVITLVQALAHEMRGHGVTVNAVLPSTMDTPANRAAMPDSDRRGWVPPEAGADPLPLLARGEAGSMTGT